MEIKSKVTTKGFKRKIVEIPKAVRDNFEVGEEVIITKVEKWRGKK